MFSEVVSYQTSYGDKRYYRKELKIENNLTTDSQAEILWKNKVKVEYIIKYYSYL